MMEHTTDRLFWTLTSIIVGALILTISVKAFPSIAEGIMSPISRMESTANNTTTTVNSAANQAQNDPWTVQTSTPQPTNNYGQTDDQAKANAGQVNSVARPDYTDPNPVQYTLRDINTSAGTATLQTVTLTNGFTGSYLNIPEYVKYQQFNADGTPKDRAYYLKITSIDGASNAVVQGNFNTLTQITVPNTVNSVDFGGFSYYGGFHNVNPITIYVPKDKPSASGQTQWTYNDGKTWGGNAPQVTLDFY